jgi:hypothetical protein
MLNKRELELGQSETEVVSFLASLSLEKKPLSPESLCKSLPHWTSSREAAFEQPSHTHLCPSAEQQVAAQIQVPTASGGRYENQLKACFKVV